MMKAILSVAVIMATAFGMTAKTTAKTDTIEVDLTKIEKIISDTTTNAKGNEVVKYYFKYGNELIGTSKSVVTKYNLSVKHNCRPQLLMTVRNGRKRIIGY